VSKNGIDLKLVSDAAQIEAIAEKLDPTNAGIWRSICRSYSQKYSTPLHEVLRMDAEFVLLHHYEGELESVDVEDNFDELHRMIKVIEDPDYVAQEQEELDDFVKLAEQQENERLRENKPIHPGMKKALDSMPTLQNSHKDLPKEGFVDLSKFNTDEET
jgi:hypothetical protein